MHLELAIDLLGLLFAWACLYGLIFLLDKSRSGRIDLLHPVLIFATLFLLYNGLVFADPTMLESPEAPGLARAGMTGMMGILAGSAAAHMRLGKGRLPVSPAIPLRVLLYWSLALTFVSLGLLIFMFVRNMGLGAIFHASNFERASATHGILTGFNFLLPIGVGFAVPLLYLRRNVFSISLLGVIGLGMGVLFLLSASRGQILHTGLLALFVYHWNVRRVSTRSILLLVFVLLLAMVVMGIVRARIGEGKETISAAVNKENISRQLGITSLEPYKCGVRNMELIADGPPGGEYLNGKSFFYFIPYLVPRALSSWERPEPLDAWYVNTYASEVAAAGGGLGFSPLVDAYFNFGLAGCFAVFAFGSFLLCRLHTRAMKTAPFSRLRLVNCLVATTMVAVHRISISGYIKNYLYVFVFAGFLLLTVCLLHRGDRNPERVARERV